MINRIKKEDVVNNSNQPQNGKSRMEILRSKHPKGKTMDDIQFLHLYSKNKEFLQLEGVKETIQQIVEFHKRNKSGEFMIRMGERLLLEYDKPKWSDEVELQFLKEDLDELENQKSYWKSRIVEGRRSFWDKGNSKYKGVVPYDTMDEYYEDISYLKKKIEKLEREFENIKN